MEDFSGLRPDEPESYLAITMIIYREINNWTRKYLIPIIFV